MAITPAGAIPGSKHFGVWPLSLRRRRRALAHRSGPQTGVTPQAINRVRGGGRGRSRSQQGTSFSAQGFELLHPARTEPWGQTVTRVLTEDGLIVGISYAPAFHDEEPA